MTQNKTPRRDTGVVFSGEQVLGIFVRYHHEVVQMRNGMKPSSYDNAGLAEYAAEQAFLAGKLAALEEITEVMMPVINNDEETQS